MVEKIGKIDKLNKKVRIELEKIENESLRMIVLRANSLKSEEKLEKYINFSEKDEKGRDKSILAY